MSATTPASRRTRTTFDILLGVALTLLGIAMIAYSAVATTVSIRVLSWVTIGAGVSLAILGGLRREEQYWWVRVAGGAALVVLGIVFLVRPETMKFTLTILAGAYFLVSGALRVISSYESSQHRLILSVGGILSIVMGAVVLLSLREESSLTLGLMIGAEAVIEGITLALTGADPTRVETSKRLASRLLDDDAPAPGAATGKGYAPGGGPVYEPPEITRD